MTNESSIIISEVPPAAIANLNSIELLSSKFERGVSKEPTDLKMDIAIESNDLESELQVKMKVTMTSNPQEKMNIEVEMMAVFQKMNDADIPVDFFSNMSAAPIIFAYIRQHISYISMLSGKLVVLPLLNFSEHYQRSQQKLLEG
jgi:preprotein translocase subunit SecB